MDEARETLKAAIEHLETSASAPNALCQVHLFCVEIWSIVVVFDTAINHCGSSYEICTSQNDLLYGGLSQPQTDIIRTSIRIEKHLQCEKLLGLAGGNTKKHGNKKSGESRTPIR